MTDPETQQKSTTFIVLYKLCKIIRNNVLIFQLLSKKARKDAHFPL